MDPNLRVRVAPSVPYRARRPLSRIAGARRRARRRSRRGAGGLVGYRLPARAGPALRLSHAEWPARLPRR